MPGDTSFAIHPDNHPQKEAVDFFDIGNILKTVRIQNGLFMETESGEMKILVYREGIIRFLYKPGGTAAEETTPAVTARPGRVHFSVQETEEKVFLGTKKLTVEIHKNPCRVIIGDREGKILLKEGAKGIGYNKAKEIICFKEMADVDHVYGLGEKTGFLNKKDGKYVMWNTDVYAPHNPETDPLYLSVPFFMAVRNGTAYGIYFDNSHRSFFDFENGSGVYSFGAAGGQMDYYFIAGPLPKDVISGYTLLTGRMPLPPKWALGYHQSRYSYQSEEEVRNLCAAFRKKNIPLDAVYLDIHYMDGYRVFTFDKERFPNPEKLVADLKKQGIMTVPIVNPGVKEDPEYPVFKEGILNNYFCRYIDGRVFYGDVWPGKSAFPDFIHAEVRDWWGERHRFYSGMGMEGIWNDMNEPAVFNESKTMDEKVVHNDEGDLKTHREMHNLYGFYMCMAAYEGMKKLLDGKRPFLLTRAGFAGVQRYAAVWTGDNRSFWEHLQMSLPMLMNMGISGIPFCGVDVGGFAHHATGELLVRWVQAGAFMPFFRNHSAIESKRQEPWAFGEKYEKIIKKYIVLRYQWLPHLYTLFAEAHKKGFPVMRALFLEYPHDEKTYNIHDQFLLGENVMIAPIMQPGCECRAAYFPEGRWIDYWTDEEYAGKQYHLIYAPLEKLPVFIKKGSAVIHGEAKVSTAVPDKKLVIHLYYEDNHETRFQLYDDDGRTFCYEDGVYLRRIFHVSYRGQEITIETNDEGQFRPEWTEMKLVIHGYSGESLQVKWNGKNVLAEKKDGKVFSLLLSNLQRHAQS